LSLITLLVPSAYTAAEFSDGVKLIQLLEIIGDETMGKYYKAPKIRVQKCENLNKALEFIKQRGVNLTNIGAEGRSAGTQWAQGAS
jgi:hypothetical protein